MIISLKIVCNFITTIYIHIDLYLEVEFCMDIQVVSHSISLAQENRQWDQELLEHPPQEEAGQNGHRPNNPQAKKWVPSLLQRRLEPWPHGSVGECSARSRSQTRKRIQTTRTTKQPRTYVLSFLNTNYEARSQQNHTPTTKTTLTTTVPRRAQSVAKFMVKQQQQH